MGPSEMTRSGQPTPGGPPGVPGKPPDGSADPRESQVVLRPGATALVRDVAVGTGCFATSACDGLGCLVLEGLFVHEVHVGGRTSAELMGPGDLLRPAHHDLDELFERQLMQRALVPAR